MTDSMELGITLDFGQEGDPLDQRFGRFAELVEAAERAGFGMLSTGEQHPTTADYFHLPSPLVALGWFAGRTSMTLGTGVVLLPTWDPLRLAHDAAVLDQMTGGRLVLGVAGGNPSTWERFGIQREGLGDRLDETMVALKALWSGSGSGSGSESESGSESGSGGGHRGDALTIEGPVLPRPTRPGGPPLIVGGLAGRALRRAAELGDGWFGGTNYQLSHQITPTIERYRTLCAAAGREPGQVVVNRLAIVAETEAELAVAAQPAIDLLRLYASMGTSRHPDGTPITPDEISIGAELVADVAIIGTPDQARAQLDAYRRAGVTQLQLRVQPAGVDNAAARRTIELLASP